MSEESEGVVAEVLPIAIVYPKGGKPYPAVDCPRCGKSAPWLGVAQYTRNGHRFITYACVEDDGCGAVGSRPLREGNKMEDATDVQE
jgi:hypothetical protein